MLLIIILLVLGLQRLLDFGEDLPRLNWFERYLIWMQGAFKRTPIWTHISGILLIIFPVLMVVGLIEYLFNHGLWVFGVPKFLLSFIVLFYCLDAYQFRHRLFAYFTAFAKEDRLQVQELSLKFIGPMRVKSLSGSLSDLARAITSEIFLKADQKLFGILFWFILLGPAGAIAYYMAVELHNYSTMPDSRFVELSGAANKVFGVLDWFPVRALGISYALVGAFVTGFNYWRKNFFTGIMGTYTFAVYSGLAALGIEHVDVIHADPEENEAALELVDRTVYLWIVMVAIFTLGGWL